MKTVLRVTIRKRSIYNKVTKFARTLQYYKNAVYALVRDYYSNYGDITPFLRRQTLQKVLEGRLQLAHYTDIDWFYKIAHQGRQMFNADTFKSIVRQLQQELKSVVAKAAKDGKLCLPKPRKLDKLTKIGFVVNPNMFDDKRIVNKGNKLAIRLNYGKVFTVKIPHYLELAGSPTIVWYRHGCIDILIPYKTHISDFKSKTKNWLAIDLGVNNLVACVSNVPELRSFLINGRPLKAFNQWCNKLHAKLQQDDNRVKIHQLWHHRERRFRNELNRVANFVIQVCLKYHISTIIIGDLFDVYQQKSEKSSAINQQIHQMPLGKLKNAIIDKAKLFGIKVILVNEAYTSRISSITGNIEDYKGKEDVQKLKFTGVRDNKPRGRFVDYVLNKIFNADLNGALNIAIKALGNCARQTIVAQKNWLTKLCNPIKLTLNKYAASEALALLHSC